MPRKPAADEQVINHYGAVRLRVNGFGNLRMTLFSLDESLSDVLVPITMSAATDVEPNRLSNLTQQRAKLLIQTTGISENFLISKIIIFVKPVAKSWPETS
jgi:hypothetical protein